MTSWFRKKNSKNANGAPRLFFWAVGIFAFFLASVLAIGQSSRTAVLCSADLSPEGSFAGFICDFIVSRDSFRRDSLGSVIELGGSGGEFESVTVGHSSVGGGKGGARFSKGVIEVVDGANRVTHRNFTPLSVSALGQEAANVAVIGDADRSPVVIDLIAPVAGVASGSALFIGDSRSITVNVSGRDGRTGLTAGEAAAMQVLRGELGSSDDIQTLVGELALDQTPSTPSFRQEDLSSSVGTCEDLPGGRHLTPEKSEDGLSWLAEVNKASNMVVTRAVCQRQTNEEFSVETICARPPETKETLTCSYPDLVRRSPIWKRPSQTKQVALACTEGTPSGSWELTCAKEQYAAVASVIRPEYVSLKPSRTLEEGHRRPIASHFKKVIRENGVSFNDSCGQPSQFHNQRESFYDTFITGGDFLSKLFTRVDEGGASLEKRIIRGDHLYEGSHCGVLPFTKMDELRLTGAFVKRYDRNAMPGTREELNEGDPLDITKLSYWATRSGDGDLIKLDLPTVDDRVSDEPHISDRSARFIDWDPEVAVTDISEESGSTSRQQRLDFFAELAKLNMKKPNVENAVIDYKDVTVRRQLTNVGTGDRSRSIKNILCGLGGYSDPASCQAFITDYENASSGTAAELRFREFISYKFSELKMGVALQRDGERPPGYSEADTTYRAVTTEEVNFQTRALYIPGSIEVEPIMKVSYCRYIKMDDGSPIIETKKDHHFIGPETSSGKTARVFHINRGDPVGIGNGAVPNEPFSLSTNSSSRTDSLGVDQSPESGVFGVERGLATKTAATMELSPLDTSFLRLKDIELKQQQPNAWCDEGAVDGDLPAAAVTIEHKRDSFDQKMLNKFKNSSGILITAKGREIRVYFSPVKLPYASQKLTVAQSLSPGLFVPKVHEGPMFNTNNLAGTGDSRGRSTHVDDCDDPPFCLANQRVVNSPDAVMESRQEGILFHAIPDTKVADDADQFRSLPLRGFVAQGTVDPDNSSALSASEDQARKIIEHNSSGGASLHEVRGGKKWIRSLRLLSFSGGGQGATSSETVVRRKNVRKYGTSEFPALLTNQVGSLTAGGDAHQYCLKNSLTESMRYPTQLMAGEDPPVGSGRKSAEEAPGATPFPPKVDIEKVGLGGVLDTLNVAGNLPAVDPDSQPPFTWWPPRLSDRAREVLLPEFREPTPAEFQRESERVDMRLAGDGRPGSPALVKGSRQYFTDLYVPSSMDAETDSRNSSSDAGYIDHHEKRGLNVIDEPVNLAQDYNAFLAQLNSNLSLLQKPDGSIEYTYRGVGDSGARAYDGKTSRQNVVERFTKVGKRRVHYGEFDASGGGQFPGQRDRASLAEEDCFRNTPGDYCLNRRLPSHWTVYNQTIIHQAAASPSLVVGSTSRYLGNGQYSPVVPANISAFAQPEPFASRINTPLLLTEYCPAGVGSTESDRVSSIFNNSVSNTGVLIPSFGNVPYNYTRLARTGLLDLINPESLTLNKNPARAINPLTGPVGSCHTSTVVDGGLGSSVQQTAGSWIGGVRPYEHLWRPVSAGALYHHDQTERRYLGNGQHSAVAPLSEDKQSEAYINHICDGGWVEHPDECLSNYSFHAGVFFPFLRTKSWIWYGPQDGSGRDDIGLGGDRFVVYGGLAGRETGRPDKYELFDATEKIFSPPSNRSLKSTLLPLRKTSSILLGGPNAQEGGRGFNPGGFFLPPIGVTAQVQFSRFPVAYNKNTLVNDLRITARTIIEGLHEAAFGLEITQRRNLDVYRAYPPGLRSWDHDLPQGGFHAIEATFGAWHGLVDLDFDDEWVPRGSSNPSPEDDGSNAVRSARDRLVQEHDLSWIGMSGYIFSGCQVPDLEILYPTGEQRREIQLPSSFTGGDLGLEFHSAFLPYGLTVSREGGLYYGPLIGNDLQPLLSEGSSWQNNLLMLEVGGNSSLTERRLSEGLPVYAAGTVADIVSVDFDDIKVIDGRQVTLGRAVADAHKALEVINDPVFSYEQALALTPEILAIFFLHSDVGSGDYGTEASGDGKPHYFEETLGEFLPPGQSSEIAEGGGFIRDTLASSSDAFAKPMLFSLDDAGDFSPFVASAEDQRHHIRFAWSFDQHSLHMSVIGLNVEPVSPVAVGLPVDSEGGSLAALITAENAKGVQGIFSGVAVKFGINGVFGGLYGPENTQETVGEGQGGVTSHTRAEGLSDYNIRSKSLVLTPVADDNLATTTSVFFNTDVSVSSQQIRPWHFSETVCGEAGRKDFLLQVSTSLPLTAGNTAEVDPYKSYCTATAVRGQSGLDIDSDDPTKNVYWQLLKREVRTVYNSGAQFPAGVRLDDASSPPSCPAGVEKVKFFITDDGASPLIFKADNNWERPLDAPSSVGSVDPNAPSCPGGTREVGRVSAELFSNAELCYDTLTGVSVPDTRGDKTRISCDGQGQSGNFRPTIIVGTPGLFSARGTHASTSFPLPVGPIFEQYTLFSGNISRDEDVVSIEQLYPDAISILYQAEGSDDGWIPASSDDSSGCLAGESCSPCLDVPYDPFDGTFQPGGASGRKLFADNFFKNTESRYGELDPFYVKTKQKQVAISLASSDTGASSVSNVADDCRWDTVAPQTPRGTRRLGAYLAPGDQAQDYSAYTHVLGHNYQIAASRGLISKQFTPWSSERLDGNSFDPPSCVIFNDGDAVAREKIFPIVLDANGIFTVGDGPSAQSFVAAVKGSPDSSLNLSPGRFVTGGRWVQLGIETEALTVSNSTIPIECRISVDSDDTECDGGIGVTYETVEGFQLTFRADAGEHGGNAGSAVILTTHKPESVSILGAGGRGGEAGSTELSEVGPDRRFTCYEKSPNPLDPWIKVYRFNKSLIQVAPAEKGNDGNGSERLFYGWGINPQALKFLQDSIKSNVSGQ